jgi:hypothetical protein
MVHSSVLAVSIDGECLTCGGFSLSETMLFGTHEFVADCFSSLSLSSRRNDSGAAFMATTLRGPPSQLQGGSAFPLLGGTTRGLNLSPLQPRHGWMML